MSDPKLEPANGQRGMTLYRLTFDSLRVYRLHVEAPSIEAAERLGERIASGEVDGWDALELVDGDSHFECADLAGPGSGATPHYRADTDGLLLERRDSPPKSSPRG